MDTPILRYTVDVVAGNPPALADQIERVFREHDVAASCKDDGMVVSVEVSTLTLELTKEVEEHLQAWMEQAALEAAATIRIRELPSS